MVNRLLLTGRDALDRAVKRFLDKREEIQREEDSGRGAESATGGHLGGRPGDDGVSRAGGK